jgi:biotin operon repressor
MAGYSVRQCPNCKETKKFRKDVLTCGCVKSAWKGEQAAPSLSDRDLQVKKLLLGKSVSLTDLANKLETSPKLASEAIARLQAAGHNVDIQHDRVTINREIQAGNSVVVNSADFFDGKDFKFGALGDTHMYSKYERLDVLEALYDIYEKEGISSVYHTGNAVDGEFRFNKFDLRGPSGIGPQIEYFAKNYPKRDGITTYFITGDDHEGWWINREGVNIGRLMQDAAEAEGRTDLKFIGHVETDIILKAKKGQAVMRIMHPGGGSAYATSYTAQKIVESFQGGEKPHILLIGHYHKFEYGYPREVHVVQTGCTQDQTPFMRKLKIQAHVGGTIVRFHQADTGEINRFNVEWIPFYDRGFYEKGDKYKRW